MKRLIINEARCKNCLYCVANCPRKALSVATGRVNAGGYPPVEVDTAACILCGICYQMCPDTVFEIREGE